MSRFAWMLAGLVSAVAATASGAPNRWTSVSPPGGFVSDVQVVSLLTAYASVDGISVTIDGGQTWTPRNTGLPKSVDAFLIDRTDPNVLNAIAANYLFRSVDGGMTWVPKPI